MVHSLRRRFISSAARVLRCVIHRNNYHDNIGDDHINPNTDDHHTTNVTRDSQVRGYPHNLG